MLKTKKEIKNWLDKYRIKNYTINKDLTVDVDEDVWLDYARLIEIPVQFNKVNGNFRCQNNSLTSLVGCPKIVLGNFYCNNNSLTLLIGSPKIVSGNFYCNNNSLISLEGSPKEVGGCFDCEYNPLTSLKYLPEIHGYIYCHKCLHKTKEYKVYEINKKLKELV